MTMVEGFLCAVCSPMTMLFFIIASGYGIGRIKVKGLSLGTSGVFIMAITVGMLLSVAPEELQKGIYHVESARWTSVLSTLGMSMFMSVIGLRSGLEASREGVREQIRCVLIGGACVVVNMLVMLAVLFWDASVPWSMLCGLFCGSMTSTPGLTAVSALGGTVQSLASIGYGMSYLIGVMGTVFFVQLVSRVVVCREQTMEVPRDVTVHRASAFDVIMMVSMIIVVGDLMGRVRIPLLDQSIGSSVSILFVGTALGGLVGYMNKGRKLAYPTDTIRDLGLCFFYVGNGIPAGMNFLSNMNGRFLLYGVVFTALPLAVGYFVTMLVTKKDKGSALCMLCGIMTSTPSFGVLLGNCNVHTSYRIFSLTYTGAMFAMVIGMRLVAFFCDGCF